MTLQNQQPNHSINRSVHLDTATTRKKIVQKGLSKYKIKTKKENDNMKKLNNNLTKREYYLNKWNNDKTLNYIPEQGETFIQCSNPHPEYWFLSSHGRLFSVYGQQTKQLQVYIIPTGKKNSDGERTGRVWAYNQKVNGKTKQWTVYGLVAHYFLENEFLDEEAIEVHHKEKSRLFVKSEPFRANRKENLQLLPKSIHKVADRMTESGIAKQEKKIQAAINKGLPVIGVDLEKSMLILLRDTIKQGVTPVVYLPTGDGKVEVIPITMSMLGLNENEQ